MGIGITNFLRGIREGISSNGTSLGSGYVRRTNPMRSSMYYYKPYGNVGSFSYRLFIGIPLSFSHFSYKTRDRFNWPGSIGRGSRGITQRSIKAADKQAKANKQVELSLNNASRGLTEIFNNHYEADSKSASWNFLQELIENSPNLTSYQFIDKLTNSITDSSARSLTKNEKNTALKIYNSLYKKDNRISNLKIDILNNCRVNDTTTDPIRKINPAQIKTKSEDSIRAISTTNIENILQTQSIPRLEKQNIINHLIRQAVTKHFHNTTDESEQKRELLQTTIAFLSPKNISATSSKLMSENLFTIIKELETKAKTDICDNNDDVLKGNANEIKSALLTACDKRQKKISDTQTIFKDFESSNNSELLRSLEAETLTTSPSITYLDIMSKSIGHFNTNSDESVVKANILGNITTLVPSMAHDKKDILSKKIYSKINQHYSTLIVNYNDTEATEILKDVKDSIQDVLNIQREKKNRFDTKQRDIDSSWRGMINNFKDTVTNLTPLEPTEVYLTLVLKSFDVTDNNNTEIQQIIKTQCPHIPRDNIPQLTQEIIKIKKEFQNKLAESISDTTSTTSPLFTPNQDDINALQKQLLVSFSEEIKSIKEARKQDISTAIEQIPTQEPYRDDLNKIMQICADLAPKEHSAYKMVTSMMSQYFQIASERNVTDPTEFELAVKNKMLPMMTKAFKKRSLSQIQLENLFNNFKQFADTIQQSSSFPVASWKDGDGKELSKSLSSHFQQKSTQNHGVKTKEIYEKIKADIQMLHIQANQVNPNRSNNDEFNKWLSEMLSISSKYIEINQSNNELEISDDALDQLETRTLHLFNVPSNPETNQLLFKYGQTLEKIFSNLSADNFEEAICVLQDLSKTYETDRKKKNVKTSIDKDAEAFYKLPDIQSLTNDLHNQVVHFSRNRKKSVTLDIMSKALNLLAIGHSEASHLMSNSDKEQAIINHFNEIDSSLPHLAGADLYAFKNELQNILSTLGDHITSTQNISMFTPEMSEFLLELSQKYKKEMTTELIRTYDTNASGLNEELNDFLKGNMTNVPQNLPYEIIGNCLEAICKSGSLTITDEIINSAIDSDDRLRILHQSIKTNLFNQLKDHTLRRIISDAKDIETLKLISAEYRKGANRKNQTELAQKFANQFPLSNKYLVQLHKINRKSTLALDEQTLVSDVLDSLSNYYQTLADNPNISNQDALELHLIQIRNTVTTVLPNTQNSTITKKIIDALNNLSKEITKKISKSPFTSNNFNSNMAEILRTISKQSHATETMDENGYNTHIQNATSRHIKNKTIKASAQELYKIIQSPRRRLFNAQHSAIKTPSKLLRHHLNANFSPYLKAIFEQLLISSYNNGEFILPHANIVTIINKTVPVSYLDSSKLDIRNQTIHLINGIQQNKLFTSLDEESEHRDLIKEIINLL